MNARDPYITIDPCTLLTDAIHGAHGLLLALLITQNLQTASFKSNHVFEVNSNVPSNPRIAITLSKPLTRYKRKKFGSEASHTVDEDYVKDSDIYEKFRWSIKDPNNPEKGGTSNVFSIVGKLVWNEDLNELIYKPTKIERVA